MYVDESNNGIMKLISSIHNMILVRVNADKI
jgi:hypothetical protein